MVNPVELVGGAGLGTGVSGLYAFLQDLISKSHVFASHFRDIQSRLQLIEPVFTQMSASNLNLTEAEEDILSRFDRVLTDGKALVHKCAEIARWNRIRRYRYENKLIGWEEKLEKQIAVVHLLGSVVGMMTRDGVANLTEAMNNTMEAVNNMRVDISQTMRENSGMQDQSAVLRAWIPEHPVGLDGALNKLKKKLLEDDGLSNLVLTGPAGCGKTTLASMFCLDEQVKDKFKEKIIFVTISKNPKMDLIVEQLYHKRGKAPAFTNEETAEKLLPTFMSEEGKGPLLLVLDDVWPGSQSLLQLFVKKMSMRYHKILVTSRSQFEGFGYTQELQLLDPQKAMELFVHSALSRDGKLPISEDDARQIVNYCRGLPLALIVVGQSLCGEPDFVWINKLSEWSRGCSSILDSEKKLLRCLQSSIDELKEQIPVAMKCFLDFGIFPPNKYIPVATIFDMWAELYNLCGGHQCITKLYELTSRSLAKFVDGNTLKTSREVKMEADGCYSQHFVIQHVLLRELAIYISKQIKEEDRTRLIIEISGEKHPEWWCEPECQTMQALLLSISTDGKFSMEWPNIKLPKAKVLVLFFQKQDYALPKFVDKMPELKVLVITCDGSYVLGAALSSFQPLYPLSKLKTIILEGISIPSITENPILLKSVKKISLSRCYKVSEAFRDCISHFFPNLEVMNIDFCTLLELPSDLGSLELLRELNITNCCGLSTLPESTEKLANLEVLRLRFCKDFSKFQHSIKLQRLKTLDLAYCSSIRELPEYIGELSSLRYLNTRNCPGLNELPRSTSNLKQLEVVCSSKTKRLTEALPHGKNIPMEAPAPSFDDFS